MTTSADVVKTVEGVAPLLQVFDMPASLRFYRDQIGFTVVASSGQNDEADWVMMNLNNACLMLNTAYEKPHRPPTFDRKRLTGHSDITLYFGCPDIDDLYRYFVGKGLEVQKPTITGYGWKAISLIDPDRYKLCFHWPVK